MAIGRQQSAGNTTFYIGAKTFGNSPVPKASLESESSASTVIWLLCC